MVQRLADLLRLEPSEWPEESDAPADTPAVTGRGPDAPATTTGRGPDATATVPGQRTGPVRRPSWFARPR